MQISEIDFDIFTDLPLYQGVLLQPPYQIKGETQLFVNPNLLSQHWFWDEFQSLSNSCIQKVDETKIQIHKVSNLRRRKLIDFLDWDEKISNLMLSLSKLSVNDNELIIGASSKYSRKTTNSSRRSMYIGVFKNWGSWQALTSINGRKTYLKTCPTQLEAAKTYDFYSILLNWLDAKTNFDYTKAEIVNMVDNYFHNGWKFIA